MTASEQMFFLGSPLAHVVQYEEQLRGARLGRPGRDEPILRRERSRYGRRSAIG